MSPGSPTASRCTVDPAKTCCHSLTLRDSIFGASREYFTTTVVDPTTAHAPSTTSALMVFDPSRRPEMLTENSHSVFEIVFATLLTPRKKFTVLVGFVLPETATESLLTVVSATGFSMVMTAEVDHVPASPGVIVIVFVTTCIVSVSITDMS